MKKLAPGISQRFMLPYGAAAEARADDLRFYSRLAREYGGIVRWNIGPITLHVVTAPEYVQHVLVDNHENYPRSRFSNALLRLAVGDGMVTTDGQPWRRTRRMMWPSFQRQRIAGLVPLINKSVERVTSEWFAAVANQTPIDLGKEMMRLALLVVGEALFSKDISANTDRFGSAFAEVMRFIDFRRRNPLSWPMVVPTNRNRAYKAAIKTIDKMIHALIEERRKTNIHYDDLLTAMLQARDENDAPLAEKQIRDETLTFLVAGHETTAVALMWAFICLSRYPEVNQQLQQEVDSVLGERSPTSEDVPKLPFTRMVLEESMRIYPPVWAIGRDAAEDDEIADFHIPRKSTILLTPYVTHRDPTYWPNPEAFQPSRFSADKTKQRPKFAYFPFGGGPHICIGMEFALLEATVAIAKITQQFQLDLIGGHPVQPESSFTLRPKYGVYMHVRRRQKSTTN